MYELDIVSVHGKTETLGVTGAHPFFSVSRGEWIRTENLRIGEQLKNLGAACEVSAMRQIPGLYRVYNLTVEDDHVYHVGALHSLVHNVCKAAQAAALKGGSYKAVRNTNVGGEVHHIISQDVLKKTGHQSASKGPSIWMTTKHHRELPSSQGKLGAGHRDQQEQLIKQGKVDEAFLLGVDEIQKVHGNKYDDAIWQAIDAL